jgi:hypothetical protein
LDGRRAASLNDARGVREYVEIIDGTTPRMVRQAGVVDRWVKRQLSYQGDAEDTTFEE